MDKAKNSVLGGNSSIGLMGKTKCGGSVAVRRPGLEMLKLSE